MMNQYTVIQLRTALAKSWSPESIYPGLHWDSTNPARGQCVVSALVIQHYLGGDFRRYQVVVDGITEKHYVNVLPNGEIVDTTRSQYAKDVKLIESSPSLDRYTSVREKLLDDKDTQRRYQILSLAVAKQLGHVEMAT